MLAATLTAGPIAPSNWVIPDVLCAGGYPGSADEHVALAYARAMATARFDTYVNLMETEELERFHPYANLVASEGAKLTIPLVAIEYVHFPIADRGLPADEPTFVVFIDDLIARINKGRKLYVHCWGGHGRTGTVMATLLARLHNIDAKEALAMWKHTCTLHVRIMPHAPVRKHAKLHLCVASLATYKAKQLTHRAKEARLFVLALHPTFASSDTPRYGHHLSFCFYDYQAMNCQVLCYLTHLPCLLSTLVLCLSTNQSCKQCQANCIAPLLLVHTR
jgi:protein-tyrosine phosphatase